MFNSLVLTRERNFEVTFGIFSVLVFQISVLESYLFVLKLVMIKNVKFRPLNQSFTNISSLQKDTLQICLILHQFNLYVLLICGKEIVDD